MKVELTTEEMFALVNNPRSSASVDAANKTRDEMAAQLETLRGSAQRAVSQLEEERRRCLTDVTAANARERNLHREYLDSQQRLTELVDAIQKATGCPPESVIDAVRALVAERDDFRNKATQAKAWLAAMQKSWGPVSVVCGPCQPTDVTGLSTELGIQPMPPTTKKHKRK
jgi:septal ring factor EnvC (AmiA/AmiB activator)